MIDRQAVNDMANIMAILNERSSAEVGDETLMESETVDEEPRRRAALSDPNIDAMRAILERLHEVPQQLVESTDPEVRHAAVTEATETGARVGSWEIVVNEGARRSYDVVHATTRDVLAKDLYLYEAALGLVKKLNEGVAINDERIASLLRLEENYAHNRDNAARFRQRKASLQETGEVVKAAIYEDRYDDASRRANDDYERILKLAGIRN